MGGGTQPGSTLPSPVAPACPIQSVYFDGVTLRGGSPTAARIAALDSLSAFYANIVRGVADRDLSLAHGKKAPRGKKLSETKSRCPKIPTKSPSNNNHLLAYYRRPVVVPPKWSS